MPNVKIFTERLSSLSYDFAKKNNIYLLATNIVTENENFKDDNDAQAHEFFKKIDLFEKIPSTATPSLGEVCNFIKSNIGDSREGIYLTPSSKLSSLYSLALKAADVLKEEEIDLSVFETPAVVSIEGWYALKAAELSNQGKSKKEILESLNKIKLDRRIVEYGVIETLKYLEKNGRIGKAKAFLGGVFKFKPIITEKDGELGPVTKVRTNSQGMRTIFNLIKEDMKRIGAKKARVMFDFGISDQFIRTVLEKELLREFPTFEIVSYNQISIVIACHFGPSVWGISLFFE